MSKAPFILALAQSEPGDHAALAREAAPDAVIATGTPDFSEPSTNVLCFPSSSCAPWIWVATTINEAMKTACVRGDRAAGTRRHRRCGAAAYGGDRLQFRRRLSDPPKPFESAPGAANCAWRWRRPPWTAAVATRPIADLDAYKKERLQHFVYRFGLRDEADLRQSRPIRSAWSSPRARTSACLSLLHALLAKPRVPILAAAPR